MPQRPPRVCGKVGCLALTTASHGRCLDHPPVPFEAMRDRLAKRLYNARRPDSDRFYKTAAWQKVRASILSRNPLCVECERLGRVTPARVVDHIKPFRDRPDLGLELENLRPLCAACHNRIGAKVSGSS